MKIQKQQIGLLLDVNLKCKLLFHHYVNTQRGIQSLL